MPMLSPTKVMCCQPRRMATLVAASRAKSSALCWVEMERGVARTRIPKVGEKRPTW